MRSTCLIEAENGTVKLQFGYDEQDQRLWTRRFARSGTEWTLEKEVRFVYSGGEALAEYEQQGFARRRWCGRMCGGWMVWCR